MTGKPGLQPEPEAPLPQRAQRCPACGAASSAIMRWPQSPEVWRAGCTTCHHAWLEASHRTLSDTLFHSGDLLVFALLAGVSLIGIAIIGFAFLSLILDASDSAALIAVVVICIVALFVIARLRIGS